MSKRKIKLVLSIRSLEIGGAERQFLEIVKNIDYNEFEVLVVTSHYGTLDNEITNAQFFCLNKNSKWDLRALWKMRNRINKFTPDVVYSFMPDMNITMSLMKLSTRKRFKLIWGQFGSDLDFSEYGLIRKKLYQIQRILEFTTDALISDAERGIEFLQKFNYKLSRNIVINSGTSIERFKRNEKFRDEFRKKYSLVKGQIAIGICSRLDPMKGYYVFAKAAKLILKDFPDTMFFSIGYGQDDIRDNCTSILDGYSDKFIWLGKQMSPEKIMSGWDIYVSPSLFGEGFSNSIIEAMSCSLPVIATDVGDAPVQINGVGVALTPGNENLLYDTLKEWIISKYYISAGEKSRKRVVENFSSREMTKKTENFIKEIL
jgi:glycosyltransferase involved in cell wall biosynthesis